jgi:hypothetical protein
VHVLHNNPFVLRSLTSLKAELNDAQSPHRMQLNFTEIIAIYCDPLPVGYSLQRDLLMACSKKLSELQQASQSEVSGPCQGFTIDEGQFQPGGPPTPLSTIYQQNFIGGGSVVGR